MNCLKRYSTNLKLKTLRDVGQFRYSTKCLLEKYEEKVEKKEIESDENQIEIIKNYLMPFAQLAIKRLSDGSKKSILKNFFSSSSSLSSKLEKGVYLYGGVGSGKTMLMNLTFDWISNELQKDGLMKREMNVNNQLIRSQLDGIRRCHFISFMKEFHLNLHRLKMEGNVMNGVELIGERILKESSIICFDEFQVTDIADAMIMRNLFQYLFDHQLLIFGTSNRRPNDLYLNGLQRSNFLPFIPLLESHTFPIQILQHKDYRIDQQQQQREEEEEESKDIDEKEKFLRRKFLLKNSPKTFFSFDDESSNDIVEWMKRKDESIESLNELKGEEMMVESFGRKIIIPNLIKFSKENFEMKFGFYSFNELFEENKSSIDYESITDVCLNGLIVSNFPFYGIDVFQNSSAFRRFITFIDIVYDKNRLLILQLDELNRINSLEQLFSIKRQLDESVLYDRMKHLADYTDGKIDKNISLLTNEDERFSIQRTISRLNEIFNSKTYWEKSIR
ncbi:hypothetical protein SNEBB_003540 [Seison nebaliae]|nr:hypothetical protein SNEBB_003540 [Seison nebaliae]